MDNTSQWDENRHQELNYYFKELIRKQLSSDPSLLKKTAEGKNLDLQEIVESMSSQDQILWKEFLQLDQLKLQVDLQNYMEGKGSSEDFQNKFYRSHQNPDEINPLW